MFCPVHLLLEFLPSGRVEKSFSLHSLRVEHYRHGWDYVRGAAEVLLCLYVLVQLVDEVREARKNGLVAYFSDLWNWIDIIRLILFCICMATYLAILLDPTARAIQLPMQQGQVYVDLERLVRLTTHYTTTCSITIVLCLFSVLKYLRHSPSYGILVQTVTDCAAELARSFLLYALVVLSFALMGSLSFGSMLSEWSTIWKSLQTLLYMTSGEYGLDELDAMQTSAFVFAFYFLYLVLVFFILVNMFLAIIMYSYKTVQENKLQVEPYPFRLSIWQEERMCFQRWQAARRVLRRDAKAQLAAAEQAAEDKTQRRIALLGGYEPPPTRRARCRRACCVTPCSRGVAARETTKNQCEGCCTQTEVGSCRKCHRCRVCFCCGCCKWWYCGCRRCGLNRTPEEIAALKFAAEVTESKLLQVKKIDPFRQLLCLTSCLSCHVLCVRSFHIPLASCVRWSLLYGRRLSHL